MKIVIGSDSLLKARDWFGSPQHNSLFVDIVSWATAREPTWGQCAFFVEVDIPGNGRTKATNVDLILAFSSRVAVCEIKHYRSLSRAQDSLSDSLDQCRTNADLVKEHLSLAHILPEQAIRPFLFLPALNSKEITALVDEQLLKSSLRHIAIAGGGDCREEPVMKNGHPVFFPRALDGRLGQIRAADRRFYRNGAEVFLENLVNPRVHVFAALDQAIEYVRTQADTAHRLRLPIGHVSNLRPESMQRAQEALANFGVVEICAPFGVGKSAFIKELIYTVAQQSSTRIRLAAISIEGVTSITELTRRFVFAFDLDSKPDTDEDKLTAQLFEVEGIAWITSYGSEATVAVRRLIDSALATSDRRCKFIVESKIPLHPYTRESGTRKFNIHFTELRAGAIGKIVEFNAAGNPDFPLAAMKGWKNPRLALARWQSPSLEEESPELVHEFSWFNEIFQGIERDVATFLICLLDDVPIELELTLIEEIAAETFPSELPATIRRALRRVKNHLDDGQLVGLRSYISRDLEKDLGNLPKHTVLVVTGVHSTLAEYVRQHSDHVLLAQFNKQITAALEHRVGIRATADLILKLRRGDLGAFCESVYRRGYFGAAMIVPWLDKHGLQRDAYLARFCRFANYAFRRRQNGKPMPKASVLGEPFNGSKLDEYLWAVVRLVASCLEGEQPDLKKFAVEAKECDDPNIAVEALCWLHDLSTWPPQRSREQSWQFIALFQSYVNESRMTRPNRMFLLSCYIFSIRQLGRDATLQQQSMLTNLYGEFFRTATTGMCDFTEASLMRESYKRVRLLLSRRMQPRALDVFEDDGNPNFSTSIGP
ncbi:MAG: hypothetical protein WC829_00790 [Hyphomicrobium sp.]|jgi:hypothetical protein